MYPMEAYNLDELVKKHGKKVFNIAFRLTGNRQDAEDVMQETFLRVHKGIRDFKGDSQIFTWIYRIAVNASLRHKNKLNKEYIDSLDEKIEMFKSEIPEEVTRWENDPEQKFLYDALISEIKHLCYHFISFRLTDRQRAVYVLRVSLGFSLDDISAILKIDKNTVKARLQRAKSNLKSYFAGRCEWLEGERTCSCKSRIGFAASFAPDIIHKLLNSQQDGKLKEAVSTSLHEIKDIDEVYRELPIEEYQIDVLSNYLKWT